MAREGLMVPLRAALLRAEQEQATVCESGVRITTDGVTREVTLEVTPVVTDPEGDPFTLSWTDLPLNATANGSLSFTPTADQAGNDYTITVTATQGDDATLSDSETFVVSVLPACVTTWCLRSA